jgi:hypothetical protein
MLVDYFIIVVHCLAISDIKALELTKLFVKEIYGLYGLSENIISNYNSRFIGKF